MTLTVHGVVAWEEVLVMDIYAILEQVTIKIVMVSYLMTTVTTKTIHF